LRPLAGQPVISIVIATISLGAVLHGVAEACGGANLSCRSSTRAPVRARRDLVPGQVLRAALAVAHIAGFTAYFHYSRAGSMRAAASDPVTAYAMGTGVRRTQHRTWIRQRHRRRVVIVASMTSLSPTLGTWRSACSRSSSSAG
jgi:branched-subunit amino acid ABC-type transport system permease component